MNYKASTLPQQSPQKKGGATRSPHIRLKLLLGALLFACVVAGVLYARQWQEQRLAHASLETLQKIANAPNAGLLPHLLYGEKLAAARRLPEAITQLRQAEKLLTTGQKDAYAERVYARLGCALALAGDDSGAKTLLDSANAINDENAYVHTGYGVIFAHRRQYGYAINQFKLAVTIDPNNYEAYYHLGRAYNNSVQPQAGAENLKRAVALAPDFAPAHAELGHSYAFQADFVPAVEQFRKALELNPANPDYERALGAALGMSARARDQYTEAVAVLTKTMQQDPDNISLMFTLGQLHLRFQNLDEAHRLLKHVVTIKPDHIEAWYNLARVEQLLGNEAEAQKDNKIFTRLQGIHDNIIIAEKKVSANVKDPQARLELAHCYRSVNNIAGTYWQLRTALMLKPDFAQAKQEMTQIRPKYQAYMAQQAGKPTTQDDTNALGPPPPAEMLPAGSAMPPPEK